MIASILRAWLGERRRSRPRQLQQRHRRAADAAAAARRRLHRAAVVELGMNHPGEIALLAAIAAPTVALVNNAQREHQEFMASVEAVARENGAVDRRARRRRRRGVPGRRRACAASGASSPARAASLDLRARRRRPTSRAQRRLARRPLALALHTPAGAVAIDAAPSAGRTTCRTRSPPTACALAAGCPLDAIARGLAGVRAGRGPLAGEALARARQRVTLVDDSYNANPDSVRAAIDVLAALPAPRWLRARRHGRGRRPGPGVPSRGRRLCARARHRALWAAGAASAHATARVRRRAPLRRRRRRCSRALGAGAGRRASVLVKGSRFMQMERVVAALATGETRSERTHACCLACRSGCRRYSPRVRLPARLPVPHVPRGAGGDDRAADRPGRSGRG